MLKDEGMTIAKKASDKIAEVMQDLFMKRDKYFGNARTVRKIVLEVIKNQNLRLASTQAENQDVRAQRKIVYDDVLQLDALNEDAAYKQDGIGFRQTDR